MNPKLTALVDGDILVYRCASACEVKEYSYTPKKTPMAVPLKFRYVSEAKAALGDKIGDFDRSMIMTLAPPEHCLHSVKHTLANILVKTQADNMAIFLGGENNFRMKVDPEYKAGRAEKPAYYQLVRDYLEEFYSAQIVDNQEVDDMLAQRQNFCTVICSIDKDLYQVPGAHYNWITDEWKYIDKAEADEWFWIQMLTGDRVDNIHGFDGIGLAYAVALVSMFDGNLRQVRGFVMNCYLQRDGNATTFFKNARLLYIRRDIDHVAPARIFTETVGL